ncbi:type I-B CRISPR-associated protein Cas8b1/Cst1 [Paenibacillus sp. IHBB 10380]|uniref:type I-B CRISPR-associated protein Cas8b1/Cst1 n=1 Tax=Paenibacillus sp. IHBB 10380 TaxID=1566358 RepID=UPI0005CFCD03|nr:type I-B CRISPR-associated protein Cas8b1/Cst1 [Paenibacillus sp. IHBB 10380]AJS57311.1 hypothetical protein UB51_01020 [Paenibacillus sp. IHBB 10380]
MSASIEIIAEDWMMTAGLIGLTRLFDKEEYPSFQTNRGIILTEEQIQQFPEKYIRWLIQNHSIVKRDVGRMEWSIDQVGRAKLVSDHNTDAEQQEKLTVKVIEAAKHLRKSIGDQAKKVEKYFSDAPEYQELLTLIERLEILSKNKEAYIEADQIKQARDDYERIMSVPFINERLTLNYVRSVMLEPFFGQTSILQKTFASKSTQQFIEQLDKDFARPALQDLQLYAERQKEITESDISALLQEHSETNKYYRKWLKLTKKLKTPQEVYDFLENEVLRCSLIDGLLATQSFEEKSFVPLGVSKNNSYNFSWDFDRDISIPMSAIARLVLFAVPIGLAMYNRRMGTEEFNENKRFFGMVMTQNSFIENVNNNNTYYTLRSGGNTMGEAITGLLDESRDKARKIHQQSYFFIELHSDYSAKKTLLEYYHMPPYLATFLSSYGKTLHLIHHTHAKDTFLRAVLKGQDPKETIYELLRVSIKPTLNSSNPTEIAKVAESKRLADSAYHAVIARKRILQAKKGEQEMANYDEKISRINKQGKILGICLTSGRSADYGEGKVYQASGRKKLDGIVYRLLNAAKSGNKAEFMDTVFRMYMSANTSIARKNSSSDKYMEVSSDFLEGFKENGLDFDTIASSFIAGLLGQNSEENKNESNPSITAKEATQS